VEKVTENDESIEVIVRERTPSLKDHVTARLTYPFLMITIPRSGKKVHVRYAARS
jgi:hypothetical protein